VIRQDAAMPISRFAALVGIPRRTYTRWLAKVRAGYPTKGPWPTPAVEAIEPIVEKYAADWPAWGHRKIHALMRADGYDVSVSTVERAMRRRNLLQPVEYQRERRELAKARKAAFADPPTGPNQVWQLDFSEFETTRGGIWRIPGCADYFSKYEFGWHLATTCNAADAELAVRIAIAEAERLAGGVPLVEQLADPVTGKIRRIKLVTDNGGAFKRGTVRSVRRLPPRAAAHPHTAPLTRPERRTRAGVRVAEVRAPLPAGDRQRADPRERGRALPARVQPHQAARGAGPAPPDRSPPTRSTDTTFIPRKLSQDLDAGQDHAAELGSLGGVEGVAAVDEFGELGDQPGSGGRVAVGGVGVEADDEPFILADADFLDPEVVADLLVAALPGEGLVRLG